MKDELPVSRSRVPGQLASVCRVKLVKRIVTLAKSEEKKIYIIEEKIHLKLKRHIQDEIG